jgi:altronate hydrolase
MDKYIKIHRADSVAVAVTDLSRGETVEVAGARVVMRDDVSTGHKFATEAIAQGGDVIKYGYPIGHATQAIEPGEHVHTHNVRTNLRDDLEYEYRPVPDPVRAVGDVPSVRGFLRSDGRMGIRNELWIVPTVGCVNGQAQAIVDRVKAELDIRHIDEVRVWSHNYGCSQLGEDHRNTRRALAALVSHPNAGGVLVLSLGCENNQLDDFKREMGEWDEQRVRFLVAQQVEDEVGEGFGLMRELVDRMRADERRPLPVSMLTVGLKCGGSDGFSGITANPLVGRFSDWLVARGGSTILTELPEMFGAETILMSRAASRDVFDRTVGLINDFKGYFRRFDQPIYENPSPGNKAGGITTLEEKSLGCTQKGGDARVVDVLEYAAPLVKHGLNLLNAPGNDLVASSALALSGCQLVLFTTGRGTPFGSLVPTMKIATNPALAVFKSNWVDFNAGRLLDGETMDGVLDDFTNFVIEVCEGRRVKHETAGFRELAIFKTGVTL